MGELLLSSGAPLVFATLVVVVWHWRSQRRGWPKRKSDYVWAFIEGGVTYVMAALHTILQICPTQPVAGLPLSALFFICERQNPDTPS